MKKMTRRDPKKMAGRFRPAISTPAKSLSKDQRCTITVAPMRVRL
jgi:hypothetical protein